MSYLAETYNFKGENVLHVALAGNLTTYSGILPANGVGTVSIVVWVYLDNAADCVVNIATADDSAGTNATALTQNIPNWIEDVKQTNAKAITFLSTLTADSYHMGVFEVPATIIPADKYIGVYLTAGNANNLVTAVAINDQYYKG